MCFGIQIRTSLLLLSVLPRAQYNPNHPLELGVIMSLSSDQWNRNKHNMCCFQIWLIITHPLRSSTFSHCTDDTERNAEDGRSTRWNNSGFQNHHLEENHTWARNISLIGHVNNFHYLMPLKFGDVPITTANITLTNIEVIRLRNIWQY